MEPAAEGFRNWPPISSLVGGGVHEPKRADAIIHHPIVSRMLRSYGNEGGWIIKFYDDASILAQTMPRNPILFVDSINELRCLRALGCAGQSTYFLEPNDEILAEDVEEFGVKALLTCPDHWFNLR